MQQSHMKTFKTKTQQWNMKFCKKSVNEYTQLNMAIISEPGIYARILLEMDVNERWKYEGIH